MVTSNHGARARNLPSGQPNASSTPPTKSFAQGTPESEAPQKRRLANLWLASRYFDAGHLPTNRNLPVENIGAFKILSIPLGRCSEKYRGRKK